LKNTLLLLALISLSVSAKSQVPHVFSDGTPAHASEVNANFEALTKRLDELESEIKALKSLNVAGHTYKLEISTTAVSRFDADPQNSASDPGFWNIDIYIEKYTLKFNDDAEHTAILETEEDRGGDLWQDGSLHFTQFEENGREVLYWTQKGSSVSLSETPGGSSVISMHIVSGASALYSIFSEQKNNHKSGSNSCGNGTQTCYGDEFENSTVIAIRTSESKE